jgi:hypothetical protein
MNNADNKFIGTYGHEIDKDDMAINFRSEVKNFSGWISPTGEVYRVDTFAHKDFLEERLQATKEMYREYMTDDIYVLAFKMGWIRVVYFRDGDIFSLEGAEEGFNKNSSLIDYLENISGKKADKEYRRFANSSNSSNSNNWYKIATGIGNSITLDDLIHRVSLGEEIAGWFSSSGDIYIVPEYSHKSFIAMKFKTEIEKLEKDIGYSVVLYDFAFGKGWVRFYADNKIFSIDCALNSLSNVYDKIKYIEERLDNKVDIHISKHLETYGFTDNWYKSALKMPKEKKLGNEVEINEIGLENHISG